MARRVVIVILLLTTVCLMGVHFILLTPAPSITHAQISSSTIYMRYFESADSILTGRYQLFSFTALKDEKITIVVYGLEAGLAPAVTLLNPLGVTIAEALNPQNEPVAALQVIADQDGIYPFIVSRNTTASGLVRIMVFEGEPRENSVTLLDTVDPFLPSRAFLFAGYNDENLPVEIEIRSRPFEDPNLPLPKFFVSRADQFSLPPLSERYTPVSSFFRTNENRRSFYTVNIRPVPENIIPVNEQQEVVAVETPVPFVVQPLLPFDFLVTVRPGGEPERLDRPVCEATNALIGRVLIVQDQPGEAYTPIGELSGGEVLQIIGTDESGEWVQIVYEGTLNGTGWVENRDFFDPNAAACVRVIPVSEEAVQSIPALEAVIETLIEELEEEILVAEVETSTPTRFVAPQTTSQVCAVTPAGNLDINVRREPTVEADPPVGVIFVGEDYPVFEKTVNQEGTWYRIAAGWVSGGAVVLEGECSGIAFVITATPTPTETPKPAELPADTLTPSITPSPTITLTPSITLTPTRTLTPTITPWVGYGSNPSPGGVINFPTTRLGATSTAILNISETGTATLNVNNYVINGADFLDFNVVSGVPVSIPDGGASVNITISCTPSSLGTKSATFDLMTNVGLIPYTLSCNAVDIHVNTLSDAGTGGCNFAECTLREAITVANGGGGVDIDFVGGGTLTLSGTELSITTSMTITGPGSASFRINGNNVSRIFNISAGTITLSGMTLQDGNSAGNGGAILNGATLTITSCTLENSLATNGGGVYNTGSLTINGSLITGNDATGNGAGIANVFGTVNLNAGNTITSNQALAGLGGAIYNSSGTLSIPSGISVNLNTAAQGGGFYYDSGAPFTLSSGTFNGNNGTTAGGGVYILVGAVNFGNVAFLNNTSPSGGVVFSSGIVDFQGTTILGGNSSPNCAGGGVFNETVNSTGGDATCFTP